LLINQQFGEIGGPLLVLQQGTGSLIYNRTSAATPLAGPHGDAS
jgi:hypothetical protein